MKGLQLLAKLVGWDLLRELRRKETVPAMALFALLVLFLAQMGLGPDKPQLQGAGPIFFWIAILFSGTVGLSQALASDRDGSALVGIVTAPFDIGIYYLAKCASTWLYAMIMEGAVFGLYVLLFSFNPSAAIAGAFLGVMGAFSLGYMAVGVVLAAMTSALQRGGEVLLRLLVIPLMIPLFILVLRVSDRLFEVPIAGGALGAPLRLSQYFVAALAMDAIYLVSGYLLFPKVVED